MRKKLFQNIMEKLYKDYAEFEDELSKGMIYPSDISFTGTDAYTYINYDARQKNQKDAQSALDQQNRFKPYIISSYAYKQKGPEGKI